MRTAAKRYVRLGVACLALAVCGSSFDGDGTGSPRGAILSAAGACDAPPNEIVAENCKPGHPDAEWDIGGATSGDPNIQGFATEISVNNNQTARFKIASTGDYQVEIYRLGYYGGLGARRIHTIPFVSPQAQPLCTSVAATGLVDCGNWAE